MWESPSVGKGLNCDKIFGRTTRILKLSEIGIQPYMNRTYLVTYAGTFLFFDP